jgi:hypothetical protein
VINVYDEDSTIHVYVYKFTITEPQLFWAVDAVSVSISTPSVTLTLGFCRGWHKNPLKVCVPTTVSVTEICAQHLKRHISFSQMDGSRVRSNNCLALKLEENIPGLTWQRSLE